jgi:heterodisulfide reductase subunit C
MDDDTTIRVEQLDREFTEELRREPGGEQIDLCIGCGRCSATCPVQAVDTRFRPRRIVRMAILGMADEVLESDFVWLCAGCYSCRERCPQGVLVTDLMRALKNVAVRRGIVHPSYRAQIAELRKYGRLYEVEAFNKKRGKNDLPALVDDPARVAGIFERTGLDALIEPEREPER